MFIYRLRMKYDSSVRVVFFPRCFCFSENIAWTNKSEEFMLGQVHFHHVFTVIKTSLHSESDLFFLDNPRIIHLCIYLFIR